ncbi:MULTISPECIES: nuclear transport factor 2 family protein [Maricaulis]|uniref:Ketosteroid isomerase-like protein n=1 Tax=Maricaulis maris TaxID=74318 RepID=A0A495D4I0_9PROT|nr:MULTISPECIES: nuclear transport factor 2 family protein [Maricaulis]RKQ96814.1 ketosteroid isomerase-like protein [Maricaulis maris]
MTHFLSLAGFATGLTLTLAPALSAQDDTNAEAEAIARTYMDHYSAVDWDAMEAMLAADMVFSDTTAQGESYGPDGIQEDGRDAMMATLREFGERYHPIELGFEWDDVFASNSRVVFIGHVNALYPTQSEGQVFRWRSRQVSVITVRDGQVVAHQDFANYAAPEQGLIAAD